MDVLPWLLLAITLLFAASALRIHWAAFRMRGRNVATGEGVQVFYCYAPHCGPCRQLTPLVERLASRHAGLRLLDVTADPALARRLGVMATPSFVRVEDGQVREFLVGAISERRLEALLGTGAG